MREFRKPETIIAVLICLALPAAAFALYFFLGNPQGFKTQPDSRNDNLAQIGVSPQIADMVSRLEQRLKLNPNDAGGWAMLARSYHTLGRYKDAADAYARLVQLVPDDAELLADYADALAMAQNKSLLGEPEKIVARALEVDPGNIKALTLSGSAAFDQQDYQTAVSQWKKILPLVDQDSEIARFTINNIDEAEAMSGQSNLSGTSATK